MLSQLCVHQPIAARRDLRSILVSRHKLLLIVPRELDLTTLSNGAPEDKRTDLGLDLK